MSCGSHAKGAEGVGAQYTMERRLSSLRLGLAYGNFLLLVGESYYRRAEGRLESLHSMGYAVTPLVLGIPGLKTMLCALSKCSSAHPAPLRP